MGYDFNQPWDPRRTSRLPRPKSNAILPGGGIPRDEQNRWLSPSPGDRAGDDLPERQVAADQDVRDGLTNTLLAVEAVGLEIVWSGRATSTSQRERSASICPARLPAGRPRCCRPTIRTAPTP